MGTVGSDPEVKQIGDSTLTKFSLATNRTFKDKKTGEKRTEAQWHKIEAWGPIGESMGQYVKKGKHIYLEGHIKYSEYEKDGVKKYATNIVATEFRFAGSNPDKNGEAKVAVTEETATESVKQYAAQTSVNGSATRTASNADVMGADEDDLPF